MIDIYKELLEVAKEYCEEYGIVCKRFARSQIEIAYSGTRNGYDSAIAYYTNKSAGVKLYIDYDVMRGICREVIPF